MDFKQLIEIRLFLESKLWKFTNMVRGNTIELWECATRTLIIPFHKNIVIEKTYMFHFQERD